MPWLGWNCDDAPDYLVFHIEAVSKLLENRNEKDIVKLFGQEDLKQKQESFRSLLKNIFCVESTDKKILWIHTTDYYILDVHITLFVRNQ